MKKRQLSVELWLRKAAAQDAGGRATEAGLQGGRDAPLLSASSPFPRPSPQHPPGAHCLLPGQYLQPTEPSHATLRKDTYSPDVTPFNSLNPRRGQADQSWKRLGRPRTHSQQATERKFKPGSILRGYCGFLGERELEVTLFLISDEAEWEKPEGQACH